MWQGALEQIYRARQTQWCLVFTDVSNAENIERESNQIEEFFFTMSHLNVCFSARIRSRFSRGNVIALQKRHDCRWPEFKAHICPLSNISCAQSVHSSNSWNTQPGPSLSPAAPPPPPCSPPPPPRSPLPLPLPSSPARSLHLPLPPPLPPPQPLPHHPVMDRRITSSFSFYGNEEHG